MKTIGILKIKGRGRNIGKALVLILGLVLGPDVKMMAAPVHPQLPFQNLVLVDEVNCGDPADPHHNATDFTESSAGISQVNTILSRSCRVLPNPSGGESRYFAYRIGRAKGLQAGKAYVLEVDYPEDQPRTILIANNGDLSTRGLHTGATVGDALIPPFGINHNPESLDMPLSNSWKTWNTLFHLHDHFADIVRPRNNNGPRPFVPADGFWVIIAHYKNVNEPLSQGAAVAAIRLYEAPPFATYAAPINFPAPELPRRYLFVREEMADDGANIFQSNPTLRGVETPINWFEYKARQMRFLGMNVFTKDLLEFGYNQGFDVGPGGGSSWYLDTQLPRIWEQIVTMANGYGLDILPYYEYAGARGDGVNGVPSLGIQSRAKPLVGVNGGKDYTDIGWAEACKVDLADGDTLEDACKVLDQTIMRFRDQAHFIGAWFRGRTSQMAFSFSSTDFEQFRVEANNGVPITRSQLQGSPTLYNRYKTWWLGHRKTFINGLRDHLREQGLGQDGNLLFTADCTEPGRSYVPLGQQKLLAESTAPWTAAGVSSTLWSTGWVNRQLNAMTLPSTTYGGYEFQHACPEYDPAAYGSNEGGLLTLSINRLYTVSDAALMDQFRTPSGLAVVRHFALNEETLSIGSVDPIGYYVSDVERTGPLVMMAEAIAMAKGDPRYFGYLSSTTFNRAFPQYVRAFNQAFLALPAVASTLSPSSSNQVDVAVRLYPTDGFGTWLGVVNTARTDRTVTITMPGLGTITDAATGTVLATNVSSVVLEMYPFQLRALHFKATPAGAPVAVADSAQTNEGTAISIPVLSNDTGPGTKTLTGVGTAAHGQVQISGGQALYTPVSGYFGSDSFSYTVSNGSGTDTARVSVQVVNLANANDLQVWGLQPRLIGVGVLPKARWFAGTGVAEIRASGTGDAAPSDQAGFFWQSVTGDFTASVRLDSLTGTNAVTGLMVRAGLNSGEAMAWIGRAVGGALQFGSRERVGNLASKGSGGTVTVPVWFRLQRVGNTITMSRSSDGTTYTTVGLRQFPGCPDVLRLGLFACGGTGDQPAQAQFRTYSVSVTPPSDQVFFQDFSSSTSVASYVSATPNSGQFDNISAEVNAGTWQIVNGELVINALGGADPNNDYGLARITQLPGAPSFVRLRFDLDLRNVPANVVVMTAELGEYATVTDYELSNGDSNHAYRFEFTGAAKGEVFGIKDGTQAIPVVASGNGPHAVLLYYNGSAAAVPYVGPDGNTYNLDPLCGSGWIDTKLMFNNRLRPGSFAKAPRDFRLRFTTTNALNVRLDNFLVSSGPGLSTPPPSNQAPTAVTDSVTLNENEDIWINVLANDTDADNGPSGLSVASVGTTTSGETATVDGWVWYRPRTGFVGNASFPYTISDGLATSVGTISVNVQSTSIASNLSALGLTGTNVGSVSSGSSRLFANNEAELSSGGSGISSPSDGYRLEGKPLIGNGSVIARVSDVYGLAANPLGGLVLREGTGAGARQVWLAKSTNAPWYLGWRTNRYGSTTSSTVATPQYDFPTAWVKLTRFGDTVTLAVGPDGANFTPVGTVQIPGLAEQLQAGFFASNAVLRISNLQIVPYEEDGFHQDFNTLIDPLNPTVAEFQNDFIPGNTLFNHIGGGGTWSIDSATSPKLKLVRSNASSYSGFLRSTPLEMAPLVAKMTCKVRFSNIGTTYQELGVIDFGDFAMATSYESAGSFTLISDRLSFFSGAAGRFILKYKGTSYGNFLADGVTPLDLTWVINESAATVSYQSPTGTGLSSLLPHTVALWAGTTPLCENMASDGTYPNTIFSKFRCYFTHPNMTVSFDDFKVTSFLTNNTPPVATNDTASGPEGQPMDINVMANDTDTDNAPSSLSVTGVGEAANGQTQLLGNGQVRYTPNPGFYGVDTFSYTVTDGRAVDWGQVTVTVTSTAQATNLTSARLTGAVVGTGVGNSRVLQDGTWEINGQGAGLAAGTTTDAGWFEYTTNTGSFVLKSRVTRPTAAQGGLAQTGLMARNAIAAGQALMALTLDSDGKVALWQRSILGGSTIKVAETAVLSATDVWLQLRRTGSTWVGRYSTDGVTYTDVGTVTWTPAASMLTGLFSASGQATASIRGLTTQWANVVFEQDFNALSLWSDLAAVSTPDLGRADQILAETPDGGTWAMNAGSLQLTRTNTVASGNHGAGFTRLTSTGNTTGVARTEMKMTLLQSGSYFNELLVLDVGSMAALQDYNSTTPSAQTADRLTIKGKGAGKFQVMFNSNASLAGDFLADGTTPVTLVWYVNVSGSTVSYQGPDNQAHTLAHGYSAIYANGVKLFTGDLARATGLTSTSVDKFRFRCSAVNPFTVKLDQMEVRSSP
jgi:regulation of enolase protein 1 (concanavalin A-like superfamily)